MATTRRPKTKVNPLFTLGLKYVHEAPQSNEEIAFHRDLSEVLRKRAIMKHFNVHQFGTEGVSGTRLTPKTQAGREFLAEAKRDLKDLLKERRREAAAATAASKEQEDAETQELLRRASKKDRLRLKQRPEMME